MVIIELVVIIQMRIAASRARRGDGVRRTAKMNIQGGGMTIRVMMGPRSRQNERHGEKRGGKERRERARRPEIEKEEPQLLGPRSPFSRLVEYRRGWLFVGA